MPRLTLHAASLLLLAAIPIRADVGPPQGTKYIPVNAEVVTGSEFPEFVFLEVHHSSYFGPPRYGADPKDTEHRTRNDRTINRFDFGPRRPFKASAGRRSSTGLYVIPKAAAVKYPDLDQLVTAVDAKEIPGASRHFFAQVKIVPVSDPRLEIKVRYRTELAPNGDGIAFIRVNNAGQPVPDGVPLGEEEISGPKLSLRWLIFGLAFAAYFAALGIWWFRRSGKKAACVVSLPQKESSP